MHFDCFLSVGLDTGNLAAETKSGVMRGRKSPARRGIEEPNFARIHEEQK